MYLRQSCKDSHDRGLRGDQASSRKSQPEPSTDSPTDRLSLPGSASGHYVVTETETACRRSANYPVRVWIS